MTRHHYSSNRIGRLKARDSEIAAGFKPCGLWYEVDGAWAEWCSTEMPHWIAKHLRYRVELDGEKILVIDNACTLDEFTRSKRIDDYSIDWPSVAREWDGIEIAPYIWERRLNGLSSHWYYPWDVASGVIWRPRGMKLTLEPLKERTAT